MANPRKSLKINNYQKSIRKLDFNQMVPGNKNLDDKQLTVLKNRMINNMATGKKFHINKLNIKQLTKDKKRSMSNKKMSSHIR